MRLTPPKKNVFWASVVLAVLALVTLIVPSLSFFASQAFVLAFAAWLLLAAGNALKGF